MATNADVIVIGAGVAGLTCAWRLKRQGLRPLLLEATGRAGGLIQTVTQDGFRVELGPNTMPDRALILSDVIDALGLKDEQLEPNQAANKRFIVRDGALVPLPMSPRALLSTPLLSTRAKLRLLAEPLVAKQPLDDNLDESLANLITRRLGEEALTYLINPFIAGTFGGKPEHLSAQRALGRLVALEQQHGSLIRGGLRARKTAAARPGGRKPGALINFERGVQSMTDAMARALGDDLKLDCPAHRLERDAHGLWTVTHAQGASCARAVILAAPAWAVPQLEVYNEDHQLDLSAFHQVEYPAMVGIALGFKRDQIAHPLDGFGVLVPEIERRDILGAIFASTIFPRRAPKDHALLMVFIGGARNPELTALDDEALVQRALHDLEALIGAHGAPVLKKVRRWRQAIPQYEVGYGRIQDAMMAIEQRAPGLLLTGNYLEGISVSDTIAHATRAAHRARAMLNQRDARLPIAPSPKV